MEDRPAGLAAVASAVAGAAYLVVDVAFAAPDRVADVAYPVAADVEPVALVAFVHPVADAAFAVPDPAADVAHPVVADAARLAAGVAFVAVAGQIAGAALHVAADAENSAADLAWSAVGAVPLAAASWHPVVVHVVDAAVPVVANRHYQDDCYARCCLHRHFGHLYQVCFGLLL